MKNQNAFKNLSVNGFWPCFLFFSLLFSGLPPTPVWAECLIEKTAFWNLDDSTRPYAEMKKQITHEPCTISENPDCPAMIQSGRYGSALKFNGQSGLSIERNGVFEWGAQDSFSIEFWMKRDNIPLNNDRNEVIMGRDDASTKLHWWIGVDWRGVARINFGSKDGNIKGCAGNKRLTDDIWHHIVFVRDSQSFENRLYVDGSLECRAKATYEDDDAFKSDFAKLNIGWINMSYRYHYLGAVDEIAIYPLALPRWFIREQYHALDRSGAPCE